MINVAVFEDKTDLRLALSALLESTGEIHCCGAWENCDNILSLMQTHNPDVVLMDIDMPGTNGLQGLEIIQKKFAEIDVIMLTVFEDDENVFNSLCLGAHGYLLKRTPPEKIIDAIKEVHAGGSPMTASIARKVLQSFNVQNKKTNDYGLTQREKDILNSLVLGNSYKMIGAALNISIDTVRSHIRKIYEKLHVHSMNEAVALALKNKIV